ncbi:MAG: TylF/MycF/NovP-related O-methyltransferase [Desulfobaccales bacterium]
MIRFLKDTILRLLARHGYKIIKTDYFPDFAKDDLDIIQLVKPFTLTPPERIHALIQSVKYVVEHEIPGDIVECGVWRGGSMMTVAKVLANLQCDDRHLYLYDTFEGMVAPEEVDVMYSGDKAADLLEKADINDGSSIWCRVSLDEVKKNVYSIGYNQENIHFIKGRVEDTIPQMAPEVISILRLDTDWYRSTLHELTHLFPRLSRGGVILIDDYGCWQGARLAADEYFSKNQTAMLLNRIDYTARVGVKIS